MKLFIDTCVWRDFLEKGKFYDETAKFFAIVITKKHEIIFCKEIMLEMKKKYSTNEIENMFFILKKFNLINIVTKNKIQGKEADKISEKRKIPFLDCLFAIIARDNNAFIITQDKHFFRNLTDIVKAYKPKDLF